MGLGLSRKYSAIPTTGTMASGFAAPSLYQATLVYNHEPRKHCSHFTNGKTEAQRGEVLREVRSSAGNDHPGFSGAEPALNPSLLATKPLLFSTSS